MRFFGLKTCDTCKKAQRALTEAGWTLEVTDVRADGLTPEDIAQIIEKIGEAALNKASTTWRGLDEAERGRPMADLLADYPTLMKRPVIEAGDWTVGWKPDVQQRWLRDITPQ